MGGERKKEMKKLTNTKKVRASGISVLRKHMGMKHPPALCNQLSPVTLPLLAESWLSPDGGQEAVRACRPGRACRGPAGTGRDGSSRKP